MRAATPCCLPKPHRQVSCWSVPAQSPLNQQEEHQSTSQALRGVGELPKCTAGISPDPVQQHGFGFSFVALIKSFQSIHLVFTETVALALHVGIAQVNWSL